MSVKALLNSFINSPRLFQLADRLSFSQTQKIYLENLRGSSPEFFSAAIFEHPSCSQFNHLIVLNDAEDAAYFHNTLENLTGALDIFYFPASFKQRKNFSLLNSSHVMLRTEALTKIASQINVTGSVNKKVLVTYPEALFEKVVVSNTLSSNIIFIKNGDTLDTGALLLKLADFGFERTDFVYEPGQFAIRGGILDIYSFGNEKPYRVELFGNEVDSIRIIDPETQLSERKLLQVSIIPNIETQFVDKEKISLLNFLPENMIVWIREEELVYKKLKDCEEELEYFFVNKNANEKAKDNSEQSSQVNFTKADFISSVDLENQIENRSCIFFGDEPVNRTSVFTLQSNTLVQPAFNRRFDLLIQDLKNWEQKGFDVYLFAENPKQLERLRIIFEDLKSNIVFNPITASIHEGFINEDLKIVCYTDHEIFQRYHKYRVKQAYNKSKALTLRTLRELQPGDFVTHIDHGVGTFSGLQKIEVNGRLQEAVRIIYKDSDILYVNINSLHKIAKYTGKEGTVPKVNKLGSDVWNKLKDKTKAKVKEIAFDLIKTLCQPKSATGFSAYTR
jgi:transcription-repair coupling factor (superfamily II helicase)